MRADPDAIFMARALSLARNGIGLTRPNPPVGAVVVRKGVVVGEGWHRVAGGPHAEIEALKKAGGSARGSTLYVTLEPCSTQGKTPPCTDAILAAGVRRVVAAMADPNPRHRGRGFRRLRAAGVSVRTGPGAEEARELLRPFARFITCHTPWVVLKLAASLDGRIADRAGESRWITGPDARNVVQGWRRDSDAILVGVNTVCADNPSLLPRPARGRKPWRVVVDSRGRTPLASRIFRESPRQTLIATTTASRKTFRTAVEAMGARCIVLPGGRGGVSLPALLSELGRMGVLQVLCEGGGRLAGALLREGCADEIRWFVGWSRILGGDGCPAVGGEGWRMPEGFALGRASIAVCGADLLIRARPVCRGSKVLQGRS